MVRVPGPGRIEHRPADGAANPYLLQAGLLAAGLDGIGRELDPGKRLDMDMYVTGHAAEGVRRLPLNLLDAVRALEACNALRDAFGAPFVESLCQAQAAGLGRVFPSFDAMGARRHPGLLSAATAADRR
jgi:glutamine synthetase